MQKKSKKPRPGANKDLRAAGHVSKPEKPWQRVVRERTLFILAITFLFVTAAFIYNESVPPVFRTTARITFDIKNLAPAPGPAYEDFYSYRKRLKDHAAQMASADIIDKLATDERIRQIVGWEESHQGRVVSDQMLKERIRGALTIDLDPASQDILIEATDTNPLFAKTLVNRIAPLYEQKLNDQISEDRNELIRLKQEIVAIVSETKHQASPKRPDAGHTQKIKKAIQTVWEEQALLYAQVREVQQILNSPYKYLPKFIKNKELEKLAFHLIKKELQLKALKSHTANLNALLADIGFLQAKFNSGLKEELKALLIKLSKNKEREKSLMQTITDLSGENTDGFLTTKLARAILKQKSLESLVIQNKLTVIKPATEPKAPWAPKKERNLIMGAVLGLLTGMLAALAGSWFHTRIRSEDDIQKHLNLPVLGVIPPSR